MFRSEKNYSISDLARILNAKIVNPQDDLVITDLAALEDAKEGELSFLEKVKLRKVLSATKASAVLLREADVEFAPSDCVLLVVADPKVAFAKLTALFVSYPEFEIGIHVTAVIGDDCSIAESATIGANCVIGANVVIGDNTIIGAGTVIEDNVVIDSKTRLWPNVTIYYGVRIGKECVIHAGAVIGADGFGMVNDNGRWVKLYQLGGVVIGNDVEIGANTTIDRGALKDTIIEDGVKLDDHVHIAHNVVVGAHTVMAGFSAVAGSTKIGRHCLFGGDVGIADNIEIADGVILTARSGVAQSITEPGIYASGMPAVPAKNWWRIVKRLVGIDDLAKRLIKLEEKIYDSSKTN